jgi:hypothetical protein
MAPLKDGVVVELGIAGQSEFAPMLYERLHGGFGGHQRLGSRAGQAAVQGDDFVAFLTRLTRAYRGRALHVILDNSSTHSTPAVHAWLAAHPRVHFHFTPTGASWLNLVEAWFSILTRKSVRQGEQGQRCRA